MTDLFQRLLAHPYAERLLTILIVLNAVTLGLETSPQIMKNWGTVLHAIDQAILTVFVIELAIRLWVHGLRFFRDGWNVFDFIVVAIALVPASESLQVLRSLRILRVLRLVTIIPSLKRVVGALIGALPGMGAIMLLMALIFYVGAVMSTKLFNDVEFGPDKARFFGDIGSSLLSLFQVMTLDAWSDGILRPVMEKHPYAWVFFVPFVLVTAFMALNLFIGVVVSALEAEGEAARKAEAEGQPLPASPLTNADVIMEIRKLREEIKLLRGARTPH